MRRISSLLCILFAVGIFGIANGPAVASESTAVIGTAEGFEDGYLFVGTRDREVNFYIMDMESGLVPEDVMKSKGRKCRVGGKRVMDTDDAGDPVERLIITSFEWLEPWGSKFRPIWEP